MKKRTALGNKGPLVNESLFVALCVSFIRLIYFIRGVFSVTKNIEQVFVKYMNYKIYKTKIMIVL